MRRNDGPDIVNMVEKIEIYKRAFETMTFEIDNSGQNETGGILLGILETNKVVIKETVDGGFDAISTETSFTYDCKYVEHVATRLIQLYNPPLKLVGVWHKHNSFHINPFSEDDLKLHKKIADLVNEGAVSVLFQKKDLSEYEMNVFHIDGNGQCLMVEFDIV